jgi:hypothetical protein
VLRPLRGLRAQALTRLAAPTHQPAR